LPELGLEEASHMTISTRPLTPVIAGEVTGCDLTKPLAREDVAAIEAGMDRHAVLVFHDQDITDEQQVVFTRNFGEIENAYGGHITKQHEKRLMAGVNDLSNLGLDNKPLPRDDRRRMFNLGNRLWHSDSSYRAIPAKYSLLSARVIVERGGNTEFADMRAAYDVLDEEIKAEVEPLVCEHSLMYSRAQLGFTELSEDERQMFKPVYQRLVRRHPMTGRKSLYLASHIGGIVGWPVPEARAFIRDLVEHATQPQFVYVHKWRRHDLVMWDNRQTMHRVRRFDETQVRDMHRTTVAGDAPTIDQAQVAAMMAAQ
jgi:alpha-ketoglutarate-dependent 2,4-dichlorophenoxyacetate dioxygenase